MYSLKDYVEPLLEVLKCSFLLLLLDIENIVQHVDRPKYLSITVIRLRTKKSNRLKGYLTGTVL